MRNSMQKKMKIRIWSDVHIEFEPFNYQPIGEDILILAGDIDVRNQHESLIKKIPSSVEILFVKGNHEAYGSVHEHVIKFFKKMEKKYPNFHFLENSTYEYNDLVFFGGTGYSDFKLYGEGDQYRLAQKAQIGINDFRYIKKVNHSYSPLNIDPFDGIPSYKNIDWTTKDHIWEHEKFVTALEKFLEQYKDHQKKIVISHFLPSEICIHPDYMGDPLNAYYASNLDRFLNTSGLVGWIHGHSHSSGDSYAGCTRIICNPKGYRNENKGFDPNLIIEI